MRNYGISTYTHPREALNYFEPVTAARMPEAVVPVNDSSSCSVFMLDVLDNSQVRFYFILNEFMKFAAGFIKYF